MVGPVRVARFFATISTWFREGIDVSWVTANGQTSAVLSKDGATYSVISVVASPDGIENILWMVNPDKMTAF